MCVYNPNDIKHQTSRKTILLLSNFNLKSSSVSASLHSIILNPSMASSEPTMNMSSAEQAPAVKTPITLSRFSQRVALKDVAGRSDTGVGLVGERIVIGGWVKSSREVRKEPVQPAAAAPATPDMVGPKDVSCAEVIQSKIPFFRSIINKVLGGGDHRIREKLDALVPKQPQLCVSILQVNDGSCIPNLQVMVESTLVPPCQVMPTGTCVLVEGVLQQPSVQGKYAVELKAEKVLHVGTVDQNKYPLTKKRVPLEMLRDSAHFRPRTTTVASVIRIRDALTQATHAFFQNNGFVYVQVPVITGTDTEGFSKKFQVTTLLEKLKKEDRSLPGDTEGVSLESLKASVQEKNRKVEELRRTDSNREALAAAIQDLKKTTELVSQLESKARASTSAKADEVNFAEDFFARPTYLTVSGRLHLESYACALGSVYSFGPRFQAEKSESKKSLAEMWMVETEMAFSHSEDAMECANELLKSMCKWVLDNCSEDLAFVSKRIDKTVVDRLQLIASTQFQKISYTEAVNLLKQVTQKKFEKQVEWGNSLAEEHESYLVDEIYRKPVIIYNHPKELKPFYARINDDGRTVASFDIVVPKVGTLVKGSENEERLNVLSARMKELGLAQQEYEWCLDLRRHGTVKHSGISLAFDPLVLYATGLNDVRDAVPFPRSFGHAYN